HDRQIDRAETSGIDRDAHLRSPGLAVALHDHAIAVDRVGLGPPPTEQADVVATERQQPGEQAAERARPDDADLPRLAGLGQARRHAQALRWASASSTNGLPLRSAPIVVCCMWPGRTIVSSGRVISRVTMLSMIRGKLPPGRSVRPIDC